MAKYSDIKGFTVQTLSTDTIASAAAGGTWASGGSMPANKWLGQSAGTQTSNLQAGGATDGPAGSNRVGTSFEYDGSSWTAGGSMNTGRYAGTGFGASNTAAVIAGGNEPSLTGKTETYNGSAFTETTDLNTTRGEKFGGAGTSTAGIVFGGGTPPNTANTETWNGSAWTEVNNLNTARQQFAGTGSAYTAALAIGGYDTAGTGKTESWDGTNWTEVTDLNTVREGLGASGTSTAALAFSGLTPAPSQTGATENFDGSTWTEVADLSTTRYQVGGSPSGTNLLALAAGGYVTEAVANTEEWTAPSTFTKQVEGQLFFNSTANAFKETISDIPNAAWSSGGNMNTGRSDSFGYGNNNTAAAVVSGIAGSPADNSTAHEQYNGSSWTEVNEMNNPRSDGSASGPFTSSIMIAGFDTYAQYSAPYAVDCETWNGTSFTEVANLNSR
jgi:hypothetical protein